MWHLILHPKYFPHTPMCNTMLFREVWSSPEIHCKFFVKNYAYSSLHTFECTLFQVALSPLPGSLSCNFSPDLKLNSRRHPEKFWPRTTFMYTHFRFPLSHNSAGSLKWRPYFGGDAYQMPLFLSIQTIGIGKRKLILSSQTRGEKSSNKDISWRLM